MLQLLALAHLNVYGVNSALQDVNACLHLPKTCTISLGMLFVTKAGSGVGCHPTVLCDQAVDQHKEEVSGCIAHVRFFPEQSRPLFVKCSNCYIFITSYSFKLLQSISQYQNKVFPIGREDVKLFMDQTLILSSASIQNTIYC